MHQHVHFPTRGDNTLDQVYTVHKGAYRASPLPHIGSSDHSTVMLAPAYRSRVKVDKPIKSRYGYGRNVPPQYCRTVSILQTGTCSHRQPLTNQQTDIQKYTETVTAYITKCTDDVTTTKNISIRANQKPWLTGEVHRLLKVRKTAFRKGDAAGLRKARADLSHTINKAKQEYTKKTGHFRDTRDSDHYGLQTPTTDL